MDTAVSFLLRNLEIENSEANLPPEVKDKIDGVRNELHFMNTFLKDSKGKRKEHDLVRKVVSQIVDVDQQAEDVIDSYIINRVRNYRRGMHVDPLDCRLEPEDAETQTLSPFDQQLELDDVEAEIHNIKATINEIYGNKDKYGIEKDTKAAAEEDSLRRQTLEVEEDEIIGFDKHSKEVIKLLKDGDSRPSCTVVSIYGMAGLGKTTFARKICKSYQVEKHFEIIAWAHVSKDSNPAGVLVSLLHSFKGITESKTMSFPQAKTIMLENLMNKRYLIVLDGIWEKQVWAEIQDCFPNENNGSRILITGRNKDVVASFVNETPHDPYELQPLEQEDSWKLFCKRVFREETCPDPLLELHGRRIVQDCKGVPLSIVISAGLLSDKRLPEQWSEIADNINRFLNQDKETHVEDVLKFSYNNLPEELKPCFLYLGIYPKDYEIPVRQLIHLWIAEGFIPVKETNTKTERESVPVAEVVADTYLCELIDRGLIQVASKRTDGGAKTCRIHDLVRDLCVSESRESKFLEIFGDVNTTSKSKPRRLSLHCGIEAYNSSNSCHDHSSTRSLFCGFHNENCNSFYDPFCLKWFLEEFKLVRVLDLGQRQSFFFVDRIQDFIYLRYLRAETLYPSMAVVESPPDPICLLRNLVTLDTRGWWMGTLPSDIWKLKHLRHLYLEEDVILPDLTRGAADNKIMLNLQTLSIINLHAKNVFLLLKERFPNLKKLGLRRSITSNTIKAKEFLKKIGSLTHLDRLKLIEIPNPPEAFPPNITKITLKKVYAWEIEKYMQALAKLPYLRILKLSKGNKSSSEHDLHFAAGGFQQLQVLVLEEVWQKNLTLGDGAIPQLRRLVVKNCTNMKGLPDELWHLKALAELEILWPSMDMASMLKNLEKQNDIKLRVYPPLDEESSF